jgi:MFS family permease
MDGVGLGLLLPVLPYLVQAFGGSVGIVTLLVAVFALGSFVGAPLLGWLSDRIGRRRVLSLSLGTSALAYVGMWLAGGLLPLFLWRSLSGAAAGREGVVTALAIDLNGPMARATVVSKVSAARAFGMLAGPALGATIAGFFEAGMPQYHGVIVAAIAMSVVTMIAVTFLPTAMSDNPMPTKRDRSRRVAAQASRVPELLLAAVAIGYAFGSIFSTTALFVQDIFGWGPRGTGYTTALLTASIAGSRFFLCGPAIRRWSSHRLLPLSMSLFFGTLLVIPFARDAPWLFCVFYVAVGVTYAFASVCIPLIMAERTDESQRGAVMGLNSAASSLSMMFSAAGNGWLFARFGPAVPFFVAGTVGCLLLLILVGMLHARGRRAAPIPPPA